MKKIKELFFHYFGTWSEFVMKLKNDKIKHLGLGLLIYIIFLSIGLYWYEGDIPFYIGNVATILIGGLWKELIWDKYMKKGTPEFMDFIATIIPGVIITLAQVVISSI